MHRTPRQRPASSVMRCPNAATARGSSDCTPVHTSAWSRVVVVETCSRSSAEPCPGASRRREQLAAERLEDRRRGDAFGVPDGDRRARQRHAVGVVRRSVEWVDEPGVAALGGAGAALLAEDRVARVVRGDDLDDRCLRGAVGGGDDGRPLALVVDVDRPAEPVDEHRPTGARRGDSDLQQLRRRRAQLVGGLAGDDPLGHRCRLRLAGTEALVVDRSSRSSGSRYSK